MPIITEDLWALRNDAGQSFPDVSAGTGRPIVDCRAWGDHALRIQLGDGSAPLTAREVADGFQFDMSARRRLTFQRKASLTFPGGEIWTPANGLTYVEFLLDDLPNVDDLDVDMYVFPLTLELAADVQLIYQPPLTQEEIDEGCNRPAWCVGSLAVYHSDGRKLGHIPRPFITDYNGTKIWGTFRRVGGVLAKVFRKTAVDALTPPLRIDATFGYDVEGASSSGCANGRMYAFFSNSTPASDGTVTALHAYITSASGDNLVAAMYDDNGAGTPAGEDRVGGSGPEIVGTANEQTWTYAGGDEPAVTSGTQYHFAFHQDSAGYVYIKCDVGTDPGYFKTTAYVTEMPATFPTGLTGITARTFSFWAVYTPSGGGAVAPTSTLYGPLVGPLGGAI